MYRQSCCLPYFSLADLQEEITVGIFDAIWHLYTLMHMEKAKGVQPLKWEPKQDESWINQVGDWEEDLGGRLK